MTAFWWRISRIPDAFPSVLIAFFLQSSLTRWGERADRSIPEGQCDRADRGWRRLATK